MKLTATQTKLANAIEAAAFNNGPVYFNGFSLEEAVRYVHTVIEETFLPNHCDTKDTPIGDREEVKRWASVDYAREVCNE